MSEPLEVANFFWEGSALGMQERACITSFCDHGFDVRVYSYRQLEIPPKAVLRDAATILPYSEIGRYTQGGMPGNLAAFSDAFRYHLLRKESGWWFDTDVLCSAPVKQFVDIVVAKATRFSAGWEDEHQVNGAVLYLADARLLDALIEDLTRVGYVFEWGAIGPKLITSTLRRLRLETLADETSLYYPIHYNEFIRLYDPDQYEWCEEKSQGALAIHLWNEFRTIFSLPNNLLPPTGSFLHTRLLNVCPSLKLAPTLPVKTFRALVDGVAMAKSHKRLLQLERDLLNSRLHRATSMFRRLLGQG
jgi:hypothetical protein